MEAEITVFTIITVIEIALEVITALLFHQLGDSRMLWWSLEKCE